VVANGTRNPRKRYNQGPVSDVLCLVLFLVFLGGWGVVAYQESQEEM
jgi:hypothetical protein